MIESRWAIRAEGLEYWLGERRIIGPIALGVEAGEIVSIVGPNGVGKSTLLAALSGDVACLGSVELLGKQLRTISTFELAKQRGVLLQDSTVRFPFRVREVVAMGRAPWRRTERSNHDDEVVTQSLVDCDVAHLANRSVQELSGGERARVALARTLAQDTPILFLDEPTAALDVHHQERTFELLRKRADLGVAVVVVVHDLGLAAAHSDRVVILSDGLIVADGSPELAFDADVLSSVYGHRVTVIRHPECASPIVVPIRVPRKQPEVRGQAHLVQQHT